MDADEKWRRSHQKWADDAHTNLLKRNAALGIGDEPSDARHVPLELLHMLPPLLARDDGTRRESAGATALLTAPDPTAEFLHKAELAELTGSQPSADGESADWFAKLVGDTQAILNNRVSLPTNHDLPLRKAELASRCAQLVEQVAEYCRGEELQRLKKGLAAMDFALVAELTSAIIEREKLARAA